MKESIFDLAVFLKGLRQLHPAFLTCQPKEKLNIGITLLNKVKKNLTYSQQMRYVKRTQSLAYLLFSPSGFTRPADVHSLIFKENQ